MRLLCFNLGLHTVYGSLAIVIILYIIEFQLIFEKNEKFHVSAIYALYIRQQNDGKSNDGVRSQPCLERANAPKSKGWTAVAAANVVAEQPAVGGAGDQVPLTQ